MPLSSHFIRPRPRAPHCRIEIPLALGWLVYLFGCPPIWGNDAAPPSVERIEAGSLVDDGSSSYWTVVSATSAVEPSTPEIGLSDFAHRGNRVMYKITVSANPIEDVSPEAPLWDGAVFANSEGKPVPTFWTAPAPATYTLTFQRPIELRYVDLTPPSRKHGFADFTVLARRENGAEWGEVEVKEATVSAGAKIDAGFRWRLQVVPQRAVEVSIRFHRGSLYFPRQIFLQDLDVWGTIVERKEEAGPERPGDPHSSR